MFLKAGGAAPPGGETVAVQKGEILNEPKGEEEELEPRRSWMMD